MRLAVCTRKPAGDRSRTSTLNFGPADNRKSAIILTAPRGNSREFPDWSFEFGYSCDLNTRSTVTTFDYVTVVYGRSSGDASTYVWTVGPNLGLGNFLGTGWPQLGQRRLQPLPQMWIGTNHMIIDRFIDALFEFAAIILFDVPRDPRLHWFETWHRKIHSPVYWN